MIDTTELLAEFLQWCKEDYRIQVDSMGSIDLDGTYESLAQEFMTLKYGTNGNKPQSSTPIPTGE